MTAQAEQRPPGIPEDYEQVAILAARPTHPLGHLYLDTIGKVHTKLPGNGLVKQQLHLSSW